MSNEVRVTKENKTLDVLKFYACILIAATHLPTVFSSSQATLYFTEWYFRFCVPLFFVSSGFFFYKTGKKGRYVIRILILYAISYLLYLPKILEGVPDWKEALDVLKWNLVIGYEHLWYLNATLQGVIVWFILDKIPMIRKLFYQLSVPVSLVLLVLGALLDEHYRLLSVPVLQQFGDLLSNFGGPRNVVFMGLPLLLLGGTAARYEQKISGISAGVLCAAWVVFRSLGFLECGYLLKGLGENFSNDLTVFGWLAAWVLFVLSFRFQMPIPEKTAKFLRKSAEYVYVLHPLVATILSCWVYLAANPVFLLTVTILLCCICGVLLQKGSAILRKYRPVHK